MTEQKHTPGPWELNGIAIEADAQEICLMGHPAQYAGDVGRMLPNHVANAALIARAPELLSENEELKEHIEGLKADLDRSFLYLQNVALGAQENPFTPRDDLPATAQDNKSRSTLERLQELICKPRFRATPAAVLMLEKIRDDYLSVAKENQDHEARIAELERVKVSRVEDIPPLPLLATAEDYQQHIKALLDHIAELKEERTWQPIEMAPRDLTEVLLYHPKGGVVSGFFDSRWRRSGKITDEMPTHFMHMPKMENE